MSAYRHLKQVSISSASSSVTITDVFDNQYDIYKVTALYDNSAGNVVKTQMIAADGTTIFSSNYDWFVMQNRPGGTYQEGVGEIRRNYQHLHGRGGGPCRACFVCQDGVVHSD